LADEPVERIVRERIVDHEFQPAKVVAFLDELKLIHRLYSVKLLGEVSAVYQLPVFCAECRRGPPQQIGEDWQRVVERVADLEAQIREKEVGGIDFNNIAVDRQGTGVNIQFDPAKIDPVLKNRIQGFTPVIINITPLPSLLPLLGLQPEAEEAQELSRN